MNDFEQEFSLQVNDELNYTLLFSAVANGFSRI